jgi:GNAT superfamily N-acetyltransferase
VSAVAAPGEYPNDLVDEVLAGEERYGLRPIRPEDASILLEFHHRLSPGSVYRRYFSVHPELSAAELAHLTTVDYVDRLAFVLTRDGVLVGVGRFDRLPATSRAEVAFVVEDRYQHRGLGAALLEHLAAAAWTRGITELVAETLADNRDMMAVFTESGFPVTSHLDDEIYSVVLRIDPAGRSA